MTSNIQELQKNIDMDINSARSQANRCESKPYSNVPAFQAAAAYRQNVALMEANSIAIGKITTTSQATERQEKLYEDYDKARSQADIFESCDNILAFQTAAAYRQSTALTAANIIAIEQGKKPPGGIVLC